MSVVFTLCYRTTSDRQTESTPVSCATHNLLRSKLRSYVTWHDKGYARGYWEEAEMQPGPVNGDWDVLEDTRGEGANVSRA